MPGNLCFVLKYFSFTFTTHLAYSEIFTTAKFIRCFRRSKTKFDPIWLQVNYLRSQNKSKGALGLLSFSYFIQLTY
jgi:hypothetical protein